MHDKSVVIISIILVLGYITVFISGFYVSRMYFDKNIPTPTKSLAPTPKATNKMSLPTVIIPSTAPEAQNNSVESAIEEIPQENTIFLKGKTYFDDTLIFLTKTTPPQAVVATVTRMETTSDFVQNTRVSYFNRSSWVRKSSNRSNKENVIMSNELIKSWNITIDPSRVLKQRVNGEIVVDGNHIIFDTNEITNEVPIRSLPGYTKFISKGEGTVTINGEQLAANVLYVRIYSLNAKDIQFYDQPFNLLTDWLIFWDTEGNMYHVDATSVKNPTDIYKTHQIAIFETVNKTVSKTFDLAISRDQNIPPLQYVITINSPINRRLEFRLQNKINKTPNNSFKWFMGTVEGKIIKEGGGEIAGVGIVEYIFQ